MITPLKSLNACLLHAMALPGLPRLGLCPSDLSFRANLATIPVYDETQYYASTTTTGSSSSGTANSGTSSGGSSASSGDDNATGDKKHLQQVLTHAEILHVARRIGFSPKSLGMDAYLAPNVTGVPKKTITLQQIIAAAPNGCSVFV